MLRSTSIAEIPAGQASLVDRRTARAAGSSGSGGATGGRGGVSGSGGASDASIDITHRDVRGGGAGTIDAGPDRGTTCTGDQKLCHGICVAKTDPVTGCGQADCAPCAFDRATATCNTAGQCAVGGCSTGFADCNNDSKDGCEADLSKVETCGACTTKCDAIAPLCSGSNGSYQCVTGCTPPASTLCGSQCVDVKANANHCGGCMMPCTQKTNGDPLCNGGMCDFSCHTGYHKCAATQTCASNTDVNQCGDTCKKCDVPANGKVACTSGDCAVTCNANYHVCKVNNVDTCLDDNSLSSCGTRCTPCDTPTDPNADAECVNKQCGSKCKTGFNLCAGICSNPSSLATCGPSCTNCVKPPNSSTISCNGTNCELTCNPGYEPSGLQCIPAQNMYVSTTGSDANAGTQAAPFRTWKRASEVAQAGTIVNFLAGTYDIVGGDDFSQPIPSGVTLQRTGSGAVTFRGDGLHSLTFAGSGTVQNIALDRFSSPLMATTGTQTIKGVLVTQPSEPIRLAGNAVMVISDASQISGAPAVNRFFVAVESSAQLTMRDGGFTGAWESCGIPTPAGTGIEASGTATVSLIGVTFGGMMHTSLVSRGSSKISLTNSRLVSTVSNCYAGAYAYENSTVSSSNTVFTKLGAHDASSMTIDGGTVELANRGQVSLHTTGRVSFRNMRFESTVSLQGPATYDFGTTADPGNNLFNPTAMDYGGLTVQADSLGNDDVLVFAVGNRWIPNEQDADASGNMPPKRVCGTVEGRNYAIRVPLRPRPSNVVESRQAFGGSSPSPDPANSCIQF